MKFLVIKLKRNSLTILFALFLIFLIAFSKQNLTAAKDGLTLWATCVVPSLFPFSLLQSFKLYKYYINIW